MIMFLQAWPCLSLRSDFRANKQRISSVEVPSQLEKKVPSQAVAMEVPLHQSPTGGLEEFDRFGIDEKQWKIPSPNLKKDNGIDVDAVLVSDLSKANFKENRAEWKVESDGASVQSLQSDKTQATEVAVTESQEVAPVPPVSLLHRWTTQEFFKARNMHLALAIGLVIGLVTVVALYSFRAAGGAWSRKQVGVPKSQAAETTPLRTEVRQDKDTEAAEFLNKKIQARLDRFEERLLRAAKNLKENDASERSCNSSFASRTGYTK